MNAPHVFDARDRLSDALAALPELAAAIGVDAAQREARRELPFEGFQLFRRSALCVLRLRARKVKHAKHRIAKERILIFNFVNDARRIVELLVERHGFPKVH